MLMYISVLQCNLFAFFPNWILLHLKYKVPNQTFSLSYLLKLQFHSKDAEFEFSPAQYSQASTGKSAKAFSLKYHILGVYCEVRSLADKYGNTQELFVTGVACLWQQLL